MKTMKMKKNDIVIPENDNEQLLEKAEQAVISDLSDRKKKKYQRSYDDRPENLRKPITQMNKEEKIEFKKWELAQLVGEEKIIEEIYTENDLYQAGSFILPFLAARLPVYRPVTDDEFSKFAKVHVPLANKYAAPVGRYKDEINGGLFWLFFFMTRITFEKEKMDEE